LILDVQAPSEITTGEFLDPICLSITRTQTDPFTLSLAPSSSVGYDNFNFDSQISVDVLRSLYLAPKVDTGKAPESSIEKQYGAKSDYNAENNTVAYSSDTKYPPVKLLPNAERKRILGEFTILLEFVFFR
jgi:hypothetical protein